MTQTALMMNVALTAKNLMKLPKLGKTKSIVKQTLNSLHLTQQVWTE